MQLFPPPLSLASYLLSPGQERWACCGLGGGGAATREQRGRWQRGGGREKHARGGRGGPFLPACLLACCGEGGARRRAMYGSKGDGGGGGAQIRRPQQAGGFGAAPALAMHGPACATAMTAAAAAPAALTRRRALPPSLPSPLRLGWLRSSRCVPGRGLGNAPARGSLPAGADQPPGELSQRMRSVQLLGLEEPGAQEGQPRLCLGAFAQARRPPAIGWSGASAAIG